MLAEQRRTQRLEEENKKVGLGHTNSTASTTSTSAPHNLKNGGRTFFHYKFFSFNPQFWLPRAQLHHQMPKIPRTHPPVNEASREINSSREKTHNQPYTMLEICLSIKTLNSIFSGLAKQKGLFTWQTMQLSGYCNYSSCPNRINVRNKISYLG